MKIVAVLKCSAGNESVGEMWDETCIFPPEATVFEVLKWASKDADIEGFRRNLSLTVAQESPYKEAGR